MHGDLRLFGLVRNRLSLQVADFLTKNRDPESLDVSELGEDLHRLRGSCSAMCIPSAVQAIRQVEACIDSGQQHSLMLQLAELDALLRDLQNVLRVAEAPQL